MIDIVYASLHDANSPLALVVIGDGRLFEIELRELPAMRRARVQAALGALRVTGFYQPRPEYLAPVVTLNSLSDGDHFYAHVPRRMMAPNMDVAQRALIRAFVRPVTLGALLTPRS